MTDTLHFNASEIFAQHQATMAASLTHRLAVAKAAQNTQLIALLEQEQKQLGLRPSQKHRFSAFIAEAKRLWSSWAQAIESHSNLSVQQIVSDSGIIFWHAHDPKTGKTLYAESSSDVVKWIEDNDLGQ